MLRRKVLKAVPVPFSRQLAMRKSSTSSDKSDETVVADSKMVVVVGGASMEFAVSRALGKYRQQKQTPSFSDDQISVDEQGFIIEEIEDDEGVKSKMRWW